MQYYEWECKYCGAIFPKRETNGACPCCGGPRPIRIGYTLIETAAPKYEPPKKAATEEVRYYLPRRRGIRSRLYSTLGFKVASGLLVLLTLVAIYVFVQALTIGVRGPLTNEELRYVAPTAGIVNPATPQIQIAWWEEGVRDWLTSSQSLELRQASNAVNLVVLSPDEVKIASRLTLKFDETWSQERPYFVEAVSVIDTEVIIQMAGQQYRLNVYMPFVWVHTPNQVVMIDTDSNIWVLSSNDVVLVDISDVEIPTVVKPNPHLEIVVSRQQ